MGFYLYKFRRGKVGETTVIGVLLLLGAVIGGHAVAGSPLAGLVHALAQPAGPGDGDLRLRRVRAAGLDAAVPARLPEHVHEDRDDPAAGGGDPDRGAAAEDAGRERTSRAATARCIPGALFPFLFITIACGAVSGFHALVASGTTPKMISRESEMRAIGFGAMLVEGFVSIMALIAAGILIPGDYFAITSTLGADALTKLGFAPQRIQELSAMVGVNVTQPPRRRRRRWPWAWPRFSRSCRA